VSASAPVGASVDLGSNSVHLLVAAIDRYDLRPLADMSAFLGLGAAVDDRAHLGAAKRGELVATLVDYAATARTHGAARITFMGTEPIRRAADGARIVAEVERASGIPLHVLTHEEEAYLTMIGVTGGRPVIHETLVVDIGGGSSEFCAVAPGRRARAAGLRLGSNRLSARFARTDPVTREAFDAMVKGADEIVASALPSDPSDLFLVGGTASNLLKVTEGGSADRVLTSARLSEGIRAVLSQPAASLTERYLVNPKRGPLLAAGAAIVDALMRRYVVDRVRVSEAGMREGAVLVAAHAGRAWRDRLPDLAHGWRR
jgi:exopolyphosphatase/guanosine-5'-triphosphate,3'-diphosphate pyrophosphatase